MRDAECVAFLQWALPRVQLRWPGFRRVRRQVCRRVSGRIRDLGLGDTDAYRMHLEAEPAEWKVFEGLCRVTISRFCRDRDVFVFLADRVLPELGRQAAAQGRSNLEIWSAGCGSGEEAYTLVLLVALYPIQGLEGLSVSILGTDAEPVVIRRARDACYPAGCLKDVPAGWLKRAFVSRSGLYCLERGYASRVTFACQDLRESRPAGVFDLILCRNMAFTYFDQGLQQSIANKLCNRLVPGGGLVLGAHEKLPAETGVVPWSGTHRIYRRLPVDCSTPNRPS